MHVVLVCSVGVHVVLVCSVGVHVVLVCRCWYACSVGM